MNLVWGRTSGGADRIVEGKFHVRWLRVPIVLALVGDRSHHFGHCVVDTLHTTASARVRIGASGEFSDTNKFADDVRSLGAELEAVFREDAMWALLKGNVPVDKDIWPYPQLDIQRR